MLVGTLDVSLLGNLLAGKDVTKARAGEIREYQNFYNISEL